MEKAFNILLSTINNVVDISPKEIELLKTHFTYEEFAPGTTVIKKGEIANKVFFISEGSMHFYHEEGSEKKTLFIFLEGLFAGAYESFLHQTPAEGFVETIEKTNALWLPYEKMKILDDHLPAWNHLQRKVAEERYIQAQKRLAAFIKSDPKERYEEILKYRPELLERIPDSILATFMNISLGEFKKLRSI